MNQAEWQAQLQQLQQNFSAEQQALQSRYNQQLQAMKRSAVPQNFYGQMMQPMYPPQQPQQVQQPGQEQQQQVAQQQQVQRPKTYPELFLESLDEQKQLLRALLQQNAAMQQGRTEGQKAPATQAPAQPNSAVNTPPPTLESIE